MSPICEIKKEVYIPSDQPNVAPCVSARYADDVSLKREERLSFQSTSDWADSARRRYSDDNGQTWSDWQPIPDDQFHPTQGEWILSQTEPGGGVADKGAEVRTCLIFQRLVLGDPRQALHLAGDERHFFDHGFYAISRDGGETWSENRMFRYEDGPEFDPDDWGHAEYLRTNEMYVSNLTPLSDGGLLIAATAPVPHADPRDEGIPLCFPSNYREGCVAGGITFRGQWDEAAQDYKWEQGTPVSLPLHVTSRGFCEIEVAELEAGDLMMVMRGSNRALDPSEAPGRKWLSLSRDGGRTWSPATDLRYDTGEQFYSPSSIHHFRRREVDGKLYWLANITEGPTEGNAPRFPLQIAEVDEAAATIKKDTVTVIDDRDPDRDSPHLQLSNFGILEDRETGNLELYLSRYGEKGGGRDKVFSTDAYRYALVF